VPRLLFLFLTFSLFSTGMAVASDVDALRGTLRGWQSYGYAPAGRVEQALFGSGRGGDSGAILRTLERAAAQDRDTASMQTLGHMYENGVGVPSDHAVAADWYRRAAEAGDPMGKTSLGMMHYRGAGVSRDPKQAFSLLSDAARQGNPLAEGYLGSMYFSGYGVERNLQEAMRWFTEAARSGLPASASYWMEQAGGVGTPGTFGQVISRAQHYALWVHAEALRMADPLMQKLQAMVR
jgi:TPR repeat protein